MEGEREGRERGGGRRLEEMRDRKGKKEETCTLCHLLYAMSQCSAFVGQAYRCNAIHF